MTASEFQLGSRTVGERHPPVLIAEVAQAHDGSLGIAHSFVDAIADAGADAVKFQTHIAAAESTPREPWRVRFSPQDETRYDYWRRMEFTEAQWRGLREHAGQRGLVFLSSPFSIEAAALLERVGVPAWKIASGEIGNLPLLERLAATRLPILFSSGMSDWAELDRAVGVARAQRAPLAVLQCATAYPCPPEQIGLNVLAELRRRYACPVGISDHSGHVYAGLASIALGASLIEVHVAFSRQMFGPDAPASLTFPELRQLAEGMRQIHRMRTAPVDKDAAAAGVEPLRRIFRKSIVARGPIAAGTVLAPELIACKKPGDGLPPSCWSTVIGRRLRRDLAADEAIQEADLEP